MSLEQGKGLIKFTGGQAVKLDALLADYNLLVQWLQDSCGEEVRVVYFEVRTMPYDCRLHLSQ